MQSKEPEGSGSEVTSLNVRAVETARWGLLRKQLSACADVTQLND